MYDYRYINFVKTQRFLRFLNPKDRQIFDQYPYFKTPRFGKYAMKDSKLLRKTRNL